MTAAAREIECRAVVAEDRSTAELIVPIRFDPAQLSMELLQALLRAAHVEINSTVVTNLEAMMAQPPGAERQERVLLATATQPVEGKDGWVQWTIDEQQQAAPSEDGAVNFYSRSAYVTVKPGDVLGIVHAPTDGVDGRDVTGKTLAAKPGKQAALKLDESINQNIKGELIAQQEGVLCRSDSSAAVRQMIEIPEYVDFSTGNIDFVGDVVVNKGVRDLFVVKATGNIHVNGLIEAATMITGGDLVAEGGMAGRNRGSVQTEGHLIARYLDNVRGEVKGDLKVEREAINCELMILGGVNSPTGMLIGGRLLIVGAINVGTVGSPAGVATELVLGSVPTLEPLAAALHELMVEVRKRRDEFEGEFKLLSAEGNKRLTSHDKERQTELQFEMHGLDQRLNRGQTVFDALRQRILKERTINLTAYRFIHCGTTITVGENAFRLNRDLHGPVRVIKDGGDIVYRVSTGEGGLLAQVAEVSAAQVPVKTETTIEDEVAQ